MKGKRLLVFSLFFFSFALFTKFKSMHAYSKRPFLAAVEMKASAGITELFFKVNNYQNIEPVVLYNNISNAGVISFPGLYASADLKEKPYASEELKLFYISPQQHSNTDVKVFMREGTRGIFQPVEGGFSLRIVKSSLRSQGKSNIKLPENPGVAKNRPASVKISSQPLLPVILKLASEAGVSVKFKGKIPENFTAEIAADSPIKAIDEICDALSLKFYREGKTWFIEGGRA
ncbi:MAG: hypothetical protein GX221_01935 [Candidatus Riflebacteria bacterium]|nr:hypothetical protein [Candidatus Riflebacteria bacterium]